MSLRRIFSELFHMNPQGKNFICPYTYHAGQVLLFRSLEYSKIPIFLHFQTFHRHGKCKTHEVQGLRPNVMIPHHDTLC